MSQISTEAAGRRESSRHDDGKFGTQCHDDPGVVDVGVSQLGPLGQLPPEIDVEESVFNWWDFSARWGDPEDEMDDPEDRIDPVEYVQEWPWEPSRQGAFIGAVLSGLPVPPIVTNARFPQWGRPGWGRKSESGKPTLGLAILAGRERLRALHDFTEDRVAVPAGCLEPHHFESTDMDESGVPTVRYGQLTAAGREWLRSKLRVKAVKLSLPDRASEQAAALVLSWTQ